MTIDDELNQALDEAIKALDIIDAKPTPKLDRAKCECGAKSLGISDYCPGHSDWCPVVYVSG